jgi:hypothetical protein
LKPIGYFLVGILTIIILNGCNHASSEKFIDELKPQHSHNKLHLFYVDEETPSNEMKEVQSFIHSNSVILDNVMEMSGHDYTDSLRTELKKLGVKTLPMYVLMNKEGIVSTSPYLSEMKWFIKQELKVK